MSIFTLSQKSLLNLKGVHPDLIKVVLNAITITTQDFGVTDGVRTLEKEREYIAAGKSTTTDSKHLIQADGFGHAVDLAPWVSGPTPGPSYDWFLISSVAEAMRQAARDAMVRVRWGGFWGELNVTNGPCHDLVVAYQKGRELNHQRVFLDGPHFEIII